MDNYRRGISSSPPSRVTVLWRLGAGALCVGYLILAAPRVFHALQAGSWDWPTVFHSTDKYLLVGAELNRGSESMLDAFGTLVGDKPLGIVTREDDPVSSLLGSIAGYLSWPRGTVAIPLNQANLPLIPIDRSRLSAVLFCGVKPPANLRSAIPLGRNVILVPCSSQ